MQGEKKRKKGKKYTRAWKQFYSGISGRGASRNQKLRFFLTMFLAYLCRCAEIALPRQNIFRCSGIQFFCHRCPFSPNYRSIPRFPREMSKDLRSAADAESNAELCVILLAQQCLINQFFDLNSQIFVSCTNIRDKH